MENIRSFIEEKKKDISDACLNYPIIRDDIFSLFDEDKCIVIYYPLVDRDNNGFNVSYRYNGKTIDFVYINTAQYKEKQIFTAAHELGHIWKVESWIKEKTHKEIDYELGERIVNRFAAELLMPENEFSSCTAREMKQVKTFGDLIQAVTALMNEFFTSYKSVVYRLYELRMISGKTGTVLFGKTERLPMNKIEEVSIRTAQEKGYSRLYQKDDYYYIDGLKDLLDEAKEKEAFSESWIDTFYEKFGLKSTKQDGALEEPLPDEENGGGDPDD